MSLSFLGVPAVGNRSPVQSFQRTFSLDSYEQNLPVRTDDERCLARSGSWRSISAIALRMRFLTAFRARDVRNRREALASPGGQIWHEDVGGEVELWLEKHPPAAR